MIVVTNGLELSETDRVMVTVYRTASVVVMKVVVVDVVVGSPLL